MHELHRAYKWWKLLSRSFLPRKVPCHSFTRPPQLWKLLFGSLYTLTLVWTSFVGHPQWRKEACTSSIAVKTAFYVFPCTENAMLQVNKTCPMVKTALWIFLDTQTGMNKLCKTSIIIFLKSHAESPQGLHSGIFYAFSSTKRGMFEFHSSENVFPCLSLYWKCCATG